MIDLTRLNGHRIILNPDLIRFVEAAPDTTITLITGEKLIVADTCEQLTERIRAFRAAVLREAWPDAAQALAGNSALRALDLPCNA